MHGAIPPLPRYAFVAWFLVKNRDNFTFSFTFIINLYRRLSKAAKTEEVYQRQTCLWRNRHRICLWAALVLKSLVQRRWQQIGFCISSLRFLDARAYLCNTKCVQIIWGAFLLTGAWSHPFRPNTDLAQSVQLPLQFLHCISFSSRKSLITLNTSNDVALSSTGLQKEFSFT
jgi:hypothetical protein